MIKSIALYALLPFLAAAAPAAGTPPANPTVTIASGIIVGTATQVSNQPTVTGYANAYLGVPYASPPLRFAPPTAPQPYQTLTAQTLPPSCLQEFFSGEAGERVRAYFNNPGLPAPAESEDCLYLNVFAPQSASPTNLKSVLFWIYGGNLAFGTASLAYYNGSSLAVNEDVVVVAINYRTNIFGFSNSPEIPVDSQNSGFLDQRFALQWVQDNIQAFGGDPTKVTIFGESAGGFSVKQLLAQPPSPLPFRAAIMESQNALILGSPSANYANVVAHFNCTSAASQLSCLRAVSGPAIQDYITEQGLFFGPVKDKTNVDANTLPAIASGQFARVPVLIGSNKDEFRVFSALFGLNPAAYPNLASLVFDVLGLNISLIEAPLAALYGGTTNLTSDSVNALLTDLAFTCPTQTLSTAIASKQSVNRYYYSASFPNLQLFPNAGSYHSSEIPSVFGTYPLVNELGAATPTQIALSAYMQGVWAGFAKDPGAGAPWPKLGSTLLDVRGLGVLGGRNVPAGLEVRSTASVDAACLLINPVNIAAQRAF